ncbi:hypothetical protein HF086_014188 [Spodoptera exigua]|uniref:Uncharacterized protein n=1 Tax=Spodoptera exigua TaxID=7107 RepID=A0A922MZW4_SPOEX|nr:hypothetical protein HF086_014188 [Spodoptera exigua]
METPVLLLIQICLIQYALSQRINAQTITNVNQFRTNPRNIQLQGQITTPESIGLDISGKVPITPNQQINLGTHIVPNSNDNLLTNVGASKTVLPRTPLNEARTKLEGQSTTQGTGLAKDTLAKIPAVPKTPINPYKPLLANNNAFMNPSMTNMGLGIGVMRQAETELACQAKRLTELACQAKRTTELGCQTWRMAELALVTFVGPDHFCPKHRCSQLLSSRRTGISRQRFSLRSWKTSRPGLSRNNAYGLSGNSFVPSNGGGFAVSSFSPIAPTGITVISENAIEGALAVNGELPFLGAVAVEGALPSAGAGGINYGCGSGAVGIVSEGVAPVAPAGPYGVAPGSRAYGPSLPGYGPGLARAGPGCAGVF